jgi:hypothetical protein
VFRGTVRAFACPSRGLGARAAGLTLTGQLHGVAAIVDAARRGKLQLCHGLIPSSKWREWVPMLRSEHAWGRIETPHAPSGRASPIKLMIHASTSFCLRVSLKLRCLCLALGLAK